MCEDCCEKEEDVKKMKPVQSWKKAADKGKKKDMETENMM